MSRDADVIVVGAGLAGLVAAAELIDAKKKVIILDQEPEQSLGGQAFWSFGGIFLVNSPEQRRLGIRDSCELALQDWVGSAAFDRECDHWPHKWAEAYVAFAAVGRLLNAAQPIGRIDFGEEKLKGYAFRTEIDDTPRETLVAWSETKPTTVKIAGTEQMYDYLGRKLPVARKIELTRAPIFFVLPAGGSKSLTIVPPPAKAKWLDGKASPVVLQLLGKTDFKKSAYLVDNTGELRLVAYNFGNKPAGGKLAITGAKTDKAELELAPGAREELTIKTDGSDKVTARLELGNDEHAIVAANVQKAQLKN